MANDKKFIVKNGLLTQENVVIGSTTDNGIDRLQVTGSSLFTGAFDVTQSVPGTPSFKVTNDGGSNALVAQFEGDAQSLNIVNISAGDYEITNTGQNNGIRFYNDISGVEIVYNNSVDLEFSTSGIDFKREPSYNGFVFWNAGNDGAGSGLDADVLDGLDSTQFLRSDQDDTMNGSLIITGDLTVSGNTTYINTEEILLADNIITLNADFTSGTPTENAGIEVERGSETKSSLTWDESNDWWKLNSAGTDLGRILTTADEARNGGNLDADTLDQLDSTQFLRADEDDTTTGNLTVEGDLTVGDGNGTATIKLDAAGGVESIAALNGEIGFLDSTFNFGLKLKTNNDVEVRNDILAERFIDKDATGYFAHPGDNSVFHALGIDDELFHNGNDTTKIRFDTNIIQLNTNGATRLTINDTGVTSTVDIVGPRFVDSDNNSYLLDPDGNSVLNTISIDSDLIHNGDTDTKLSFATDSISLATGGSTRLSIDNTSSDFTGLVTANDLDVYSGTATGEMNVGIAANQRFNFHTTSEQGYIRYYQDESGGTANHSVNFEIQSTSTYPHKFTFNKDIALGSNTVEAGNGIFSTAVYAPKYWDGDDVTHYGDFGNTGTSLYFAGQSQGGNGAAATPTYSFKDDPNTGMFRGSADRLDFSAGGNVELQVHTTYASAPGSFRAPLFYDLDNTSFYLDPASDSVLNNINLDGQLRHNGDTNTYITFGADLFSVVTGGTQRLGVDNDSADFSVNVFAPRYYDSNDNNYYLDPAATSILNRIDINDYIRHNGDTDNYFGFAANDTFRVFTGGTQRLNVDNDSINASVNVFAPQYYTDNYLIHNGDTDTYIGFDAVDQFGVWTGGANRLTINSTSSTFANKLIIPDYIEHAGDTNTYIGFDANDNFGIWTAGNKAVEVDVNGHVGIGGTPGVLLDVNKPTAVGPNPFTAGNILFRLGDDGTPDYSLRTDSFGNIYHINDNSGDEIWYTSGASGRFAILNDGNVIAGGDSVSIATTDGTPNFLASLSGNRFHVDGGIQLNGKNNAVSIYAADGANTAINEATFLAVNELGFSAGGGFYMDETTRVKVRGNKDIFTTGNYYGGRYYDGNDENYYVDPAGDSQMNTIDIDDYIRHRGDTDTYIGFDAADRFRVWTGGTNRLSIDTDSADFSVDVYAPNVYAARYYDSPDGNYYLDPASTSVLNRIDINDYIRHNGDTDNYFGFAANDTFRVFTGGTQRLNIDNNSADFAVNVYAPRYYDSDNGNYYLDPAGTSILKNIQLNDGANPTYIQFGPGVAANDDAHIEWVGASNAGVLRFSTADDNGTEYMEFGDYDNVSRGGAFTQWSQLARNYFSHNTEIRAPIFRDSNDPSNYYTNQAGTSVHNVQRVNQLQIDGSTYIVDSPSGDYGSIQVGGAKGGWAGYAINDDWVFMSNGTTNAGIYNDTRNEWSIYMQDNNFTRLYSNGIHQIGAENGYGSAANSMRAPVYYGPSSTSYYLDLDASNTSNQLRIGGKIERLGFNTSGSGTDNVLLNSEDRNHWIWNTATDWGMFWATNSSSAYRDSRFGDNTISFVGNGNLRALIDLDTGNILSNGEIYAGNYNLDGGNESVPLNPAYGAGTSEQKLFDGNLYWEKRAIDALRGNENSPTGTTSEYVKSTDAPGSSSYVLRTSAYRDFYSDMIEVEPGEEVYGEMWVKYISGSGGLFYYGIERFDKDKNPIAGNTGTTYFVAGGNNVTSGSWTKFSGHTTIPTSHTAYSGSDGGGVRYVRIRVLMNYNAGGALREFTAPILVRTNVQSRVRTDQAIYSPIYYDSNDENFYLDPASTSKLNTVDASNFRDRDNTARFMNPATGGNVQGSWNWNNGSIINLNNLTFNDPGPSEGVKWNGGNSWQIYESPDNLSTNSGGNLQFTSGGGNGTMRGRIDVNGDIWAGRYMRAQRFYDSNDGNYYADPAGSSIFANLYLRSGGLKMERNYGDNAIWWNAGTDANHVLWNQYYGGPGARGAAGSGSFDGMLWNTYQGLRIRGGLSGAYDIARFSTDGAGNGNAHYVQLYANNVEQLGTRGGYGYAPNSMRSPIFYDQDDTSYYGDFASTSRMNVINANMYSLNDGWDIYDDNGETLSIRSNNGDHGTVVFRDSGGTDCGRIYFDDDDHWGFKSPDDEWQIYLERNARTILYYNGSQQARTQNGYFEANNQMRAPIYYDSNDTGFYANPNATSRFRDLTMIGVIDGPGITGYSSYLIRTDNRTIEPDDIPSGRMQFGFTSWNNNNGSPYADYLHLRSYTDASGGSDNLVMFKKSGIGMRIWQQTWNSGSVYSTYRNVAVYNENPDGTTNDLYADTYYDENTTSRYLQPAGTSQLNTVRINGGNELQFTTSAGNLRGYIRATDTNDSHLQIATSGGEDIEFLDGGLGGQRNFLIRGDGNTFTTGTHYAQRFTDSNDNNYYADPASTSVFNSIDNRGEIYNDGWFRNDTGGRGLYSTPYAQHWMATSSTQWNLYGTGNSEEIRFSTSGNNPRGHVYANNSNEIGFLDQSRNWNLRTSSSVVDSYRNFYAPIMYDRNDSGYYADPNGTSRMNTVRANYFTNDGGASSDDGFGIYWDSGRSSAYAIFREGGGWSYPYPDLRIAFHTGIKFGANASYQGMRFYNDYNMAGQVMSINNSSDPLGGDNVYVNNNLQAGSSLRAPIFYDSNDTNYRMDMNATNSSRFRGVQPETMAYMALPGHTRVSGEYYRARPRQTGDTNYWTGAMGWGRVDMNDVGTWGSGFIDSWSNPPNQPSGTSHWVGTQAYHYRNSSTSGYGWQMVGGPIENLRFRSSWAGWRTWRTIPVLGVNDNNNAAMYANIYYDSDNTGYYCDPSSFSNLNSGLRATEIYARNWFRNDNAYEGMYNQATGAHSYSHTGQYWSITGNNSGSSMSLQLRSHHNGTLCRWMYGDRTWSGDLNAAGQWQLQTRHQDGYSPSIRFIESGNESWTGNIGNDAGKLEYHSNRFYLESGGNSSLIVQFRRNGSNRSYIDNNGLYVGTATSARWADLAERYSADDIYENGTVMGIDLDGDAEITIWREGLPMVGVISTNPAVQMNDMGIKPGSKSKKAKMNPFIALKGRIPCKVSGEDGAIKKGMWLIPDPEAAGKAKGVPYGTPGVGHHEIIGIALSDSKDGEVEVKI